MNLVGDHDQEEHKHDSSGKANQEDYTEGEEQVTRGMKQTDDDGVSTNGITNRTKIKNLKAQSVQNDQVVNEAMPYLGMHDYSMGKQGQSVDRLNDSTAKTGKRGHNTNEDLFFKKQMEFKSGKRHQLITDQIVNSNKIYANRY